MDLSIALWTNGTVIDLSCISAVHPLTAAVAERGVLLGAGVAQPVAAKHDHLPARSAPSAAGAYKICHCATSFTVL